MATAVFEDLNEREVISDDPTRLTGYRLKSTGTRDRFVEFFTGNQRVDIVVVKAGGSAEMSGLNEPYPEGLAVESRRGDGMLVASIFWRPSPLLLEVE